jgi:16S rRNA (cytosine1402-N4)-methyltransferase
MAYHVPALLDECIIGLNIRPDGIYVDVTFGGGGHSGAILSKLKNGKLIAFDQDDDAAVNAPSDSRFTLLNQNFRFLKNNLRFIGVDRIDGLIADLGVSFHQFDTPERGFTFRHDAPLDMRMNRNAGEKASDLLARLNADDLANIFYLYGELTNSRKIARAIVEYRENKAVITVNDLISAVAKLVPHGQEHKFYARVFQSLRIAVNREMDYLGEMLVQTLDVLNPGGRLVVITYHSLEDRMVKNFMRSGNLEGEVKKDFYGNVLTPFRLITGKPIVPGEQETSANSRSRSAKLRIAEKI